MFRSLIRLLTALHVFRVPVLVLGLLAALPVIALGPARALLANVLMDLDGLEIFAVAVASSLTAFSAVVSINLVLQYGDERFDHNVSWFDEYRNFPAYRLGIVAILPLLGVTSWYSKWGPAAAAGLCVLGVITAFLLATAARSLQLLVADPDTDMPSIILLPDFPVLTPLFNRLYKHQLSVASLPWANSLQDWVKQITARIPRWIGAGYFKYESGVATSWYAGHAFATTLAFVSLLFYLFGGRRIPTLSYILVLLLLGSWVFAALSFFGDRYRIPVLTVTAIFCGISAMVTDTDHYFPVRPGPATAPTPAAVLLRGSTPDVIVAAAEGGGIQAAAWSARVLTGLAAEVPGFSDRMRVVSGVSGGAVGGYYFANAFFGANNGDAAALDKAWRNAMESSLDEVAWGLTNPDLQRAAVPLLWRIFGNRFEDRGQALESTFEARSGQPNHPVMFSAWAKHAADGKMPGVIFNSTIVERGSAIGFSNTALKSVTSLNDVMRGDYDIAVSTAVRLSATFPVVSPAARPYSGDGKAPALHMVDGGYYDNLGTSSLIAWLREAIPDPGSAPVKRILVLTLHSFQKPGGPSMGAPESWLYQLVAPVDTLLNVRERAQIDRGGQELRLLTEAWAGRVEIIHRPVFFPGCNGVQPPLSWKLIGKQKVCIEEGWNKIKRAELDAVKGFLGK
ncbi:MAG: hypothetical protein FJW39_04665 [Acidobacteria bacterium]|nr:hypothetical protein [Acidobacteriota bacterium]